MLGIAGLLQLGGAVAVIPLVNPVEFEQRVSLAVERVGGVGEIAPDMAAQPAALLLDRLGLGDFLDLNHTPTLRPQAANSALRTWISKI